LGKEAAALGEMETYISRTVVVAPVGSGAGEIGFLPAEGSEGWPQTAQVFTLDRSGNIYILDVVNHRVARFDSTGRFVQNIPYPERPTLWYPELLAVDDTGIVYLFDIGANLEERGVKAYDATGTLLLRYPVPSWFWDNHIQALHVDEQGVLWAGGKGSYLRAPVIHGYVHASVVAPLGTIGGVFDEKRQQDLAIPGHLLDSGGTYINYATGDESYLYNEQGVPLYVFRRDVHAPGSLKTIDQWGNMYFTRSDGQSLKLDKFDPQGKLLASFDLPHSSTIIDQTGSIYCVVFDWAKNYEIVRWDRQ
jgi:hypothetical protein